LIRLQDLRQDNIALEAHRDISEIESKTLNPDTPMNITIITDSIIERSNLQPVTNPISFNKDSTPTDDGLFSNTIFGMSAESRQRQFAYIDLHEKFFHPYVYEILKKLMPKRFERCASGVGSWIIDKGELTEIKNKNDKRYDEHSNGIQFLIDNYHNMKFKSTDSLIRKDRLKLLKNLNDDEVFISKWIVIPVIYRDIDKNSSIYKLPELNNKYNDLIRYSNSLMDSTFEYFNNAVKYNLQTTLVFIRQYGQQLLEGKRGFFHKSMLGKSIDRGSRDVISTPILTNYQRPEDNPVDIIHSGVPLAKCLIIGFDFILRYCLLWFENNYKDVTEIPAYQFNQELNNYEIKEMVQIKNPIEKYDAKYIESKINRFKNSHATRFEIITVEDINGNEYPIHIQGQFRKVDVNDPLTSTIMNRPMTWTDLFYLAAENTLSDKYCYITRYPLEGYNNIFPSKVRVLSTIKTIPAYINDKFYQYYPLIDLDTPMDRISNLFIDTITIANSHLDIIGGDYDGDQISIKMCFSIEANAEAEKNTMQIKNFVSQDGQLIKLMKNESFLFYYNLTREDPNPKMLSIEDTKKLLNLKKEELTVTSIAKLFGNTIDMTDENKGKVFNTTGPVFNIRDKMILNAGEYINDTKITTTVGKFLFNKLIIEDCVSSIIPNGYYNEIVNKGKLGKLNDIIAVNVLDKKLDLDKLIKYINDVEFWSLSLIPIFAASFSLETLEPNYEVNKLKSELLKKAPDKKLATLVDIEDQLVSKADDVLKGATGKHLFDSGARGSFENDYKNMSVSIGVVENPITKDYDFMTSNYIEGLKKEDIPAAANIVVNSEYPKAIGTAVGGYMQKSMFSVYQSMEIDKEGTDCKTHKGIKIFLDKDAINDYKDQYILDGDKNILIDDNLPDKYKNKYVIIRSPLYCIGKKICNKCIGERFYKLGITNIGLTTPAVSGSLQNASLKLRHSLKIKVNKINENEILI